jgi:hypothetical protein
MYCRVALVRTDISDELSAVLVFLHSVRRLLVTAIVYHNLLILVTLMKEALSSSETSVLRRATLYYIPEDAIPQILCLQKCLASIKICHI